MKIDYIFVHHFGSTGNDPYAKTQNLTEAEINQHHKSKYDFKSSLGFYIGYSAIIWPDGTLKWYRKIGEELAANRGYNQRSIAICLAGNFTKLGNGYVEKPTDAQVRSLTAIALTLIMKQGAVWTLIPKVDKIEIDIPIINIKPHRAVSLTSCYGSYLSDSWARDLVISAIQAKLSLLEKLLLLYQKMLELLQRTKLGFRLGSESKSCWDSLEKN